jgi:hypothetical protein
VFSGMGLTHSPKIPSVFIYLPSASSLLIFHQYPGSGCIKKEDISSQSLPGMECKITALFEAELGNDITEEITALQKISLLHL